MVRRRGDSALTPSSVWWVSDSLLKVPGDKAQGGRRGRAIPERSQAPEVPRASTARGGSPTPTSAGQVSGRGTEAKLNQGTF